MAGGEHEALLDAAPDALIGCEGGGCIVFLNRAAERLLDLRREELVGQPLERLLARRPSSGPALGALRRRLERRSGRPLRLALRGRDGARKEVEVTAGVSGQGQAERVLLTLRQPPQSQEQSCARPPDDPLYQAVVEHAPLGIFHFDTTPAITGCNEHFVHIIGSSRRALVGLNLLTLRDEALMDCVRAALRGQHAHYESDYRSVTAAKVTPVHVHLVPCFGADGQTVAGGVGLVEDLSAQRASEQESARLLREAQEAARVREDFLSVASHELKTPLTPLALRLQSLERRLERGEPVAPSLVRQAREHLSRLTFLINDLLDASRIEAGRLSLRHEPLRLDALVEHAVQRLRAGHRGAGLCLELPPRPLEVRADGARLEQVVSHLVDNALKYSPEQRRVEVRLEARGELALLSVRDEGIGIPPDEQRQLFSRYFRARNVPCRSYGGLGLGLYICRDIVERHGGRIWVESQVGQGSTFFVALPLLHPAHSEAPQRPPLH